MLKNDYKWTKSILFPYLIGNILQPIIQILKKNKESIIMLFPMHYTSIFMM